MFAVTSGERAKFDMCEMKSPEAAGLGNGPPSKGERKERSC